VVKDKGTISKIAALDEEFSKEGWEIEKTRIKEARHRAFIDGPPGSSRI
jgi:hypothetical protein